MKETKMKTPLMTILAVGLLAGLVRAEDKPAFKDPKEKSSYSIGANWGNSLKRQEVEVDLEATIKGLRDRSEERRVGKECRSRGSPEQQKKNKAAAPVVATTSAGLGPHG